MKRTLIVAAHLDDETFGMGGTIYRMCQTNPLDLKILIMCQGRDTGNALERLTSMAKIQGSLQFQVVVQPYYDLELEYAPLKEITKIIEREIKDFNPERVFTVSEDDIHQDHKIVSHATKIACRPERTNINELYEFKIPGSQPFTSTYYDTLVNLTDEEYKMKIQMAEMYQTENLPKFNTSEYFKTIYRKLDV